MKPLEEYRGEFALWTGLEIKTMLSAVGFIALVRNIRSCAWLLLTSPWGDLACNKAR